MQFRTMALFFSALAAASTASASPFAKIEAPQVDARNYVLIDYASGQVLASRQLDQQVPPASLTKLMTAYLTFKAVASGALKLEQQVPVSVAAWKAGGSSMFLQPRLPVTVAELIQGMVVVSGNDAAVALSEAIGGSSPVFVQMMNAEAKRLGMTESHFDNVDGLPTPTHLVSVRDIGILTQAIISDFPAYLHYFGEKTFSYNRITQNNWNPLVFTDQSVDGMKTGHTDEAGYCLDATANRNGRRMIAVVLGSSTRNASAEAAHALLDYGFRFFETHRAYSASQVLTRVSDPWASADSIPVGTGKDIWVTLPQGGTAATPQMNLMNPLPLPLRRGQQVGTLAFQDGSGKVVPLVALAPAEKAGWFGHLWNLIRAKI